MNNIQKLESAIRSAIPELMELSEGCRYTISGIHGVYTYIGTIGELGMQEVFSIYDNEPDTCDLEWFERQQINIAGHPITLLHLLRWLGEIGYAKLDSDFILRFMGLNEMQWDYSKPLLSQQSDEVIDELVKLLK